MFLFIACIKYLFEKILINIDKRIQYNPLFSIRQSTLYRFRHKINYFIYKSIEVRKQVNITQIKYNFTKTLLEVFKFIASLAEHDNLLKIIGAI